MMILLCHPHRMMMNCFIHHLLKIHHSQKSQLLAPDFIEWYNVNDSFNLAIDAFLFRLRYLYFIFKVHFIHFRCEPKCFQCLHNSDEKSFKYLIHLGNLKYQMV